MNSHMVTVETRKEPRAKFTRTPPAACSQHTTVGTRTWSLIPTLMDNKQNFDGNQMTGRLQGIQGQGVRHRRRTQQAEAQALARHQARRPAHWPALLAETGRPAPRRAAHRNAGASASGGRGPDPAGLADTGYWQVRPFPPRARPAEEGRAAARHPSGDGQDACSAGELARSLLPSLGSRPRVSGGRSADETSRAGSHSPAGEDVPDHAVGAPAAASACPCQALRCVVCSLSLVFIVPPARTPK